jgi:hippurate hydrolase
MTAPAPDLVAFRHDLHRHPEIGFDLGRTAGKIAATLAEAGLQVTESVGGGVVATLARGPDETAIALRADMEALPIDEVTNLPHASVYPGRFHGCGHDGHSAMLVGAALALARDAAFKRTVHFVFQPAEETGHGADAMIADGFFERFPISAIYGLHNMPGLPVGHFAIRNGPFCAFEDNFEIRIAGKGGHASMPEAGIDPLLLAASMVLQLQTIVSRNLSPADHAVVSVTEFLTDGARNILPSNVVLRGDCRGFSDGVSDTIRTRMKEIVTGLGSAHGASVEIDYATSFQPLVNDPDATRRAAEAAGAVGAVDTAHDRVGFSEDFAAFLRHRPGALILMGNGTDGAHGLPLHNPGYDFNDAALGPGIAYWLKLARS